MRDVKGKFLIYHSTIEHDVNVLKQHDGILEKGIRMDMKQQGCYGEIY